MEWCVYFIRKKPQTLLRSLIELASNVFEKIKQHKYKAITTNHYLRGIPISKHVFKCVLGRVTAYNCVSCACTILCNSSYLGDLIANHCFMWTQFDSQRYKVPTINGKTSYCIYVRIRLNSSLLVSHFPHILLCFLRLAESSFLA